MILYNNSYRQILKIAGPISFSLLIPQISFVANTIFVSQLTNLDIVILGLVSIYYLLLVWMSNGLSNGLLIILSRKSGARDTEGFYRYLAHGLLLAIMMSILFVLVSWYLLPAYYRYSYHDTAVIDGGISFFQIRIWGVPFMVLSQICNILLISIGKSRWLIPASLLANASLIIVDYGLIFGNMGMPRLGVHGAALASVLSEMVHLVIVSIIILRQGILTSIRKHWSYQRSILSDIMNISTPLILQYVFSIGGWLIFFNLMEHMGIEEVAASHIIRNFMGIMGIGAWALASTSNTLVSNLLGQQHDHHIPSVIRKLSLVGLSFATIFTILTVWLRDWIISYFTQDPAVIALIQEGLIVIWVNSFIMCTGTIAFNSLMGMGATRRNMVIEISAVIIYVMYLWIIVKILDKNFFWAWTSEWLYWLILLVWSWIGIRVMLKKISANRHRQVL